MTRRIQEAARTSRVGIRLGRGRRLRNRGMEEVRGRRGPRPVDRIECKREELLLRRVNGVEVQDRKRREEQEVEVVGDSPLK